MFNVYLYDGKEVPKDDICVIVAKEGTFMKKKVGVMESIAPIDKVSFLPSIETMAKMHINKIPAQWFAKTVEFFRAVYDEHKSEAIVLPFYNEKTGQYRIIAPTQEVSGAAADYKRDNVIEGMTGIGTIHSHANFSAFHSGTDDSDEKNFDGLHITVGNVSDKEFSLSASIVANGHRVIVDPEEYVDGIRLTTDVDEMEEKSYGKTYKWDPKERKMVETESKTYMVRKFDKRYISTVSASKSKFNQKWMDEVEYKAYVFRGAYYGGAYGGRNWLTDVYGGNRNNRWGGNFDPQAWKKQRDAAVTKGVMTGGATAAKNQAIIDKAFPNTTGVVQITEKPEGRIPCTTCHFKDRAMDYAMGIIADSMESEEDEILKKIDYKEGMEVYLCEKCKTVVTVDADDLAALPTCPECKVDDHLMDITPYNMEDDDDDDEDALFTKSGYVPADEFDHLFDPDNPSYCDTCGYLISELSEKGECIECGTILVPEDAMKDGNVLDQLNPDAAVDALFDEQEEQARTDSGEFLDAEYEQIMEAAQEADAEVERIPDPEADSIPISRRNPMALLKHLLKSRGSRS